MKPYLSFKKFYQDINSIELLIDASNGRFSGETRIYISSDGNKLTDLGNNLIGFPKTFQQKIDFEMGFSGDKIQPDPFVKFNTAYFQIIFSNSDRSGHLAAQLVIREGTRRSSDKSGAECKFEICFEPNQLDIFVNDLLKLAAGLKDEAILHCLEQNEF